MDKGKSDKLEVRIDNAKIAFRNFAGAEGKFNPAGNRNFCVFLPDEMAKKMEADGWNIRWLNSYPDEPPQGMITVKLNFGNYPPNMILVSDGKMTRLDESTVSSLDFAELAQVDLILRGYTWNVSGKSGVKAYLKTGYFVLVVDELAKKYSQVANDYQEKDNECIGDDCDIFK
ncbi:MAG: hypothetical protein RBT15_04625 [Gudongella sp.]|jgi:hypothetical protein|nr:hypothetical protein [Gudongella sp.]